MLHITLPARRILRWLPGVCKICESLV